ncbi:MAG: hypothetical protein IKP73_09850 [Bacteroidales bacterium]|nr:hypothetical protein [Bacteroidales bacterium]
MALASVQIKKPSNWQDFEKLCKKLWGEIWNCPDTIKRNGRSGQLQNGVDIYGIPKGETCYYGIQCKGKDDYTNSILTKKEIDAEIQKAINFQPRLKQFIFATTANKDVTIEEYVRQKDVESRTNGLFEICLFCWEDIVDLLEERRYTYNWYINNCQYKDNTDVVVSFDGNNNTEICPQYIKTTITYSLKQKSPLNYYDLFQNIAVPRIEIPQINVPQLNPRTKRDHRWCTVKMKIENNGNTTITDYKLYFGVESDKILSIDSGVRYCNDILMDNALRAYHNNKIDEEREVYESDEYDNELIFIPNDKVLVPTDRKLFTFNIKPKDNVNEIKLYWIFKSRDYKKSGGLLIKVNPKYECKTITKLVETESELKEMSISITPKITED